jgi:two-component system invasion response regulator UvrY
LAKPRMAGRSSNRSGNRNGTWSCWISGWKAGAGWKYSRNFAGLAVRALRQGAAGYIDKRSAPEELVGAVKKVLSGGRYVSAALAERLATEVQGEAQKPLHDSLSNRELQVMRLIATGKSLKEIADDLSISVKTVGTYHTRLLQKLGMKSDVEITRYALHNKLVH